MDTNTNFNREYIQGVLPQPFMLSRGLTRKGIDIVFSDQGYNDLYDLIEYNNTNIIDFQATSEFNMSAFTRAALDRLPRKENIILGYLSEALNSTYWNVVFDVVASYGYKKIIWIDGGLTPGAIFNHLNHIKIVHSTSTMFFNVLFNNTTGYPLTPPKFKERTYYYLSLGRLARRERIYFTKKIIEDADIQQKGIYSCGWGDYENSLWQNKNDYEIINLKLFLNEEDIKKFPISLGHADNQQHHMIENFDEAIFNVVQESSVGFDHRSHENTYSFLPASWCRVNSDRLFFTEKSAKPFSTAQLPLFIAAPGYVNQLRELGFDVFDDLINHSYDKEDYIYKRCDLVFEELKRLTKLHTLTEWNFILKRKLHDRFYKNFMLMKRLSDIGQQVQWIHHQLV